MAKKEITFEYIEEQVRKKTYGVLTTIDKKGRPHSTGMIYGVSPPASKFSLYMLTGDNYVKTKNVQRNPLVSLVINFPHHWIRFAPDSYVMFRGTAEIVPYDNSDGRWAFQQSRIGRMNLSTDSGEQKVVFIKLNPEPKVFVFGLGYGILEMRKQHTEVGYKVTIPEERL